MNGGHWWRLWLELDSTEPLTGLTIRVPDEPAWTFTPGQDGVPTSGGKVAQWKRLERGGHAFWRVDLHNDHGNARTQVTCRRGKETWTVPVDVEMAAPVFVMRLFGD